MNCINFGQNTRNMKKILQLIIILSYCQIAFTQSTLITPGSGGNIQVPNLSYSQIQAIVSPKKGMVVYDNTYNVLRYFNGSTFVCPDCTAEVVNKKVRVKSFTLTLSNNNYYSSNIRDFKGSDNAVGDVIDATNTPTVANGYSLSNDEVIVFENVIPTQIQSLNFQQLGTLLGFVNWHSPVNYVQDVDVAVNSNETALTYTVREAGKYQRLEGNILGSKVYKFTNKLFIEKYISFQSIVDNLITNQTSTNVFSGFSITNSSQYQAMSTSPFFPVTSTGILTFPSGNGKPQNAFGIIYLLPMTANLPKYRLRVFTHRFPNTQTQTTYYNTNGTIKSRTTYINNYMKAIANANIPKMLHLVDGVTQNLKIADYNRVPPPTLGSESF